MIVIGLALTPAINTAIVYSKYIPFTDYKTVDPAVSNSTSALTYSPRNDSTTGAYIRVTLNATSFYGQTTITMNQEAHGNYTMAVDKVIVFTVITLNRTVVYLVTINYYYEALGSTSQTLLGLTPFFWVVFLLGGAIIVAYKWLKPKETGP
jgi:hypothetical protein